MVDESQEPVTPVAKAEKAKPAATDSAASGEKQVPPKKEKPPALEAKPFAEFINQDYLPALSKTLAELGISDLNVALEQAKIAVTGFETAPACSQVIGRWNGGNRQFSIYFFDDNIQGKRAISVVDRQVRASSIEPFLIDERKITLDLLVSSVVLRLNGQKWLTRN